MLFIFLFWLVCGCAQCCPKRFGENLNMFCTKRTSTGKQKMDIRLITWDALGIEKEARAETTFITVGSLFGEIMGVLCLWQPNSFCWSFFFSHTVNVGFGGCSGMGLLSEMEMTQVGGGLLPPVYHIIGKVIRLEAAVDDYDRYGNSYHNCSVQNCPMFLAGDTSIISSPTVRMVMLDSDLRRRESSTPLLSKFFLFLSVFFKVSPQWNPTLPVAAASCSKSQWQLQGPPSSSELYFLFES